MTSCVSDDLSFNENKDAAYEVPAATLFANSQKALTDQLTSPSVNEGSIFRYFPQYLAATQYTTESRYRISSRSIADRQWRILYATVLSGLESAKEIIPTEVAPTGVSASQFQSEQANKLAIIEIFEVYTYQIIVDSFGDVPYTDALQPKTIVLPRYDDAASIYGKLIVRLDAAIAKLDTSNGSFSSGDIIYNGDTTKWKLLANSLKVKLGVNLIDSNVALAKSTIESAYNSGVILTNENNASFNYAVSAPNYNPIYENLVASNRNDFVAASTIVNAMNALNDPRRAKYFTPLADGSYAGGKYGFTNIYTNFSHVNPILTAPDFPSLLMEATEVNFYLAEAAANGFSVGNNTEFYYNAAITSSFENWGIKDQAAAYLLNPSVNFATASGLTAEEKIANQEWIAFYNRGFESWTSYRRLNFPVLVAPTNAYAEAEGQVPKRLTYPINEQTVNGDNYTAGSAAIGGDKLKTRIFWDKN
ncbi:SusD/RagB family nutrient-binding outer membrane lipoprotein [Flavobacterium sp. Fl-77]|uniref:SusD/RagB family nutrient-binding outer membrane lipoprotein n=1 Tax=Flavobacterium flavipigmentatum TaxID=2893884 RepID=A0AAJ2SGA9_9FLAO|nr:MULTISPECIES: SusD/RagB family nutrient-binding outer membrane lipoprotein [unclassified Flavobacterium]MDX6182146.1 SusD/RagB family nutrient-binding outer membrane lipoprotein [Flavobacterium sp. Fl-33]MDX6185941.1 SusD/RagB family nutrient-binding outer membrane lipoprotein [Flavobacterium sp. Fl-77]UFH39117.1 SusD/RagB family nutrient-binding outer membrane lipoprotein [Flavobacterium sp. F-70]